MADSSVNPLASAGARSRLRWAKFWLVATGTFWGISMQLLVYQGAGHPLNQLPNIPWYLSFLLVYLNTWYRGEGRFAPGSKFEPVGPLPKIHVPVGLLDFLGTTGLNIGLILSGSAIFGIIYASVTIWTALFAYCLLGKRLTPLKVFGILLVVAASSCPRSMITMATTCPRSRTMALLMRMMAAASSVLALA